MAISVDTVYQRVLALANKEQRGYITPQEFNLLANQAQMSIFESYFYSKNTREVLDKDKSKYRDESDLSQLIDMKLNPFSIISTITDGNTFLTDIALSGVTRPVFQIGRVFRGQDLCQKLEIGEVNRILRSTRHINTTANQSPIYCDSFSAGDDINIYAGSTTPEAEGEVSAEYFLTPRNVAWAYVVIGANKKALYNANASVDFELHISEEETLVYKILELAGIVINKPGIMQIGAQKAIEETNLQNI